jgi:hypothetical protein
MTCLTNAQIQAVADGEASDPERQHVTSCARCLSLVRERLDATSAMVSSVGGDLSVPPRLAHRVDTALAAAGRSGSTRLRADDPTNGRRRRAFWSAGVAVAATALAVLFIAPLVRGPATVSAAEILAESASRLANTTVKGTEILEYELVLDGVPRDLMPDHADGTYRVKKVIDHDVAGRYRFTTFGAGGELLSSVAQDPVNGRRVVLARVEDQSYRFEFTLPANAPLSLPEIEQLHMQASVSMMQASGTQHMQVVDTPDGKAYRIEVPRVTAPVRSPVWDLTEAEALIGADDYRIIELSVKGSFLQQPYSVSFRLLSRSVLGAPGVPAEEFEVPADPGAIVFHGEGTAIPVRDALVVALREIARTRATH